MDRDAIGPSGQGFAGEGKWARFGVHRVVRAAVTRLADCRRVVDVNAEENSTHCFFSLSSSF